MAAHAGKKGYGAIESNDEDNHCPTIPEQNPKQRMEGITKLYWLRYWGIVGCITLLIFILITSVLWERILESRESKGEPLLYDYVIVGGGPSGIIAATKLANKLEDKRVLLIEAGEASQSSVLSRLQKKKGGGGIGLSDEKLDLNQFDIPLLWSGAASREEIEEGQTYGFKESLLSHHWPISSILLPKGIGGSGLVNAMIYVRCLPEDIHRWNVTGWTWEMVQKEYYDLETYKDWKVPDAYKNESSSQALWRGKNGPIVTSPSGPAMDAVAPLFLQSTLARGWPLASRGFNDPSRRVGASYYDFNIRDGIRHSIAEAMLGGWDVKEQSLRNLDIVAGAVAQEVLFDSDDQTQTTVGVKYREISGRVHHARLRDPEGEVILAGGSILTPQLLANSGIFDGGKVAHLPGVGKNLHDHPVVNMVFELSPEVVEQAPSIYTAGSDMEKYLTAVEKLKQGRYNSTEEESIKKIIENLGTFATPGFSAGAFFTSPWAKNKVPDIQITVFPRLEEPHVLEKFQQTGPLAKKFLNMKIQSTCMLVTVALLDPEARYEVIPSGKKSPQLHGDVEIKPLSVDTELNYFDLPSIALPAGKTSYLTDHDVNRITWGMEEVRAILGMSPMAQNVIEEIYPGEKVTNKLLFEHVKTNRLTNSHWVGSAKMGRADDPLAVVDEELRVHGVHGLRVVDASVIPYVPNGNTHSTVSIVASLAADLIRETRMKQ